VDSDELDLSAGKYVKGIPLSGHTFMAVTKFNQLSGIMRNPRDLQPNVKRSGYDAEEVQEEADLHELVQRALTGNKKSNVPSYATYIEDVVMGRKPGVLPPMHLWSSEPLTEVTSGAHTYLLVPDGIRLIAIDGETQLTAHFQVHGTTQAELRKAHGDFPLGAVMHHGVKIEHARQYFHDLNVLAVRPSTSLSLSMDTADPLMKVVGDLETAIPFLTGRVDKQARQLTKSSPKVLTIHALRQMTVNVAKGIAGIQYGAKPAPVDDLDLDDLFRVARDWLTAVFNTFPAEIIDRETYLIGASPVLAAIGALGHKVFQAPSFDRSRVRDEQLDSLRSVDWKKTERWAGIAGKLTPKGVFSVSGTKEVGYAIYNVLADPDNPNFGRVRSGAGTPSASDYAFPHSFEDTAEASSGVQQS
jgi:hypothetical protein